MANTYLKLITSLFARCGHFNRAEYAYAQLRVLCIAIFGAFILCLAMAQHQGVSLSVFFSFDVFFSIWKINFERAPWLQIPLIAYWAVCVWAHCNNSFKRLRDIRGTEGNELVWQVGIVVLSLVPYGKMILASVFLIKEGVISSPKTAVPLAQLIGQASGTQSGSSSDELAKLFELKKSGAISESEYQDMKKKTLGNAK